MVRASRAAALLSAALLLCGCGTIANLSTGSRQGWQNAYIYGGVRRDIRSADHWIDHSWTWGKNLDIMSDVGTVVGVALVGIDIPLSAIGDTLTLPVTIPFALMSRPGKDTAAPRTTANAPTATTIPVNGQ